MEFSGSVGKPSIRKSLLGSFSVVKVYNLHYPRIDPRILDTPNLGEVLGSYSTTDKPINLDSFSYSFQIFVSTVR